MSRHGEITAYTEPDRQGATFDLVLIRRLWKYVAPHQRYVWTSLFLLLFTAACTYAQPYFIARIIDENLTTGNMGSFVETASLVCLFAFLEIIARGFQTWTLDVAGQNALLGLRLEVFRHLQKLSSSFYDRTPIGRLIGRVTTDIEALNEMFASGVVTVIGDIVVLIGALVLLFLRDWQLTLVTLTIVPVLFALTLFIRIRVRRGYTEMIRRRSRLNAFLHEHVIGMSLVQLFRREARTRESFSEENRGMRDAQLSAVWWESALSALTEMLGSFTTALILWYGGSLVIESLGGARVEGVDANEVGLLFFFVEGMRLFFSPLNDLSLKYTVMQNAMTASDRIFTLLDNDSKTRETEAPERPERREGLIEFRGVTFGYDPTEPVLKDVSFRIEPGERVAIVGSTGGGKTTILKLLTRLYDVQRGSILLDGVDVRDYDLRDLRSSIGIVPQDVFLFEGDIVENIRLGHPSITREEAVRAADRLHLDEVVQRFPRGYEEPVRERGGNLSSGERQLVAFARVLAVAPHVLALDEATSNVDTRTEHLLQEAVDKLTQGRSALIIAHRLSTVRDVDRILVVHKGEITETGTHDELMRARGTYWRLVQLQHPEVGEL